MHDAAVEKQRFANIPGFARRPEVVDHLVRVLVEKARPGADQRNVRMGLEEGRLPGEPLGMTDVVGIHHRHVFVGLHQQALEPEVLCPGNAEIFFPTG
jgi:hypothetical protein